MGIRVGEVEAVLTARDQMSPAFVSAAESVTKLKEQIRTWTSESGKDLDELRLKLRDATAEFERMRGATENFKIMDVMGSQSLTGDQTAMLERLNQINALTQRNAEAVGISAVQYRNYSQALKEANAATESNAGITADATEKMSMMEGIATRLLLRLAVFEALRLSYDFVAGIFETNDALTKLEQTSGQTYESVSRLQTMGQLVGIPFKEVSSAVVGFDKTIAESKASTITALEELGIDVDKFFSASSDERWNMVATAISRIQDPIQRGKLEMALLKTEGLDPIFASYDTLNEKIGDSAGKFEAEHKAIQGVIDKLRELGSLSFGAGTQILGSAIMGFEALFLGGGPGLDPNAPDLSRFGKILLDPNRGKGFSFGDIRDTLTPPRTGDIDLPATYGPPTPTPSTGRDWDRAMELLQQKRSLDSMSGDQWNRLEILRETGQLNPTEAGKQGIDDEQLKAYIELTREWTKQQTAANEEAKKYARALADIQTAGDGWKGTLEGINGDVLEATKYYREAKVPMSEIQEYWKANGVTLTDTQAAAIEKSMSEEQKYNASRVRDYSAAETQIARDTEAAESSRAAVVGDSYAKQKEQANQAFDEEIRLLNEKDIDNEEYERAYAAALDKRDARVTELDNKEAASAERKAERQVAAAERAANAEARAAAQNATLWDQYYIAVEQASGTAAEIQIAQVQRQADAQRKALKESGDYFQSDMDAITATTSQRISNIIKSFDPLWTAFKQGGEDMRKEWAGLWEKGFDDASKFVNALAAPLDDLSNMWKKMLAGMLADWEYELLAPIMGEARQLLGSLFGLGGQGGGGNGVGYASSLMGGGRGGFNLGSLFGGGGAGGGGDQQIWEGYDANGNPMAFGMPIAGSAMSGFSGAGMSTGARFGGGAMMAAAGIYQLYQNQGTGSDIMGGAEAGAGIGTMIMPGIGTLVGAGIGALVGYFRSLVGKGQKEDVARDVTSQYGFNASDSLKETIGKNADRFGDEQTGEIFSIPEMMKENPISATNLDTYLARTRDIFTRLNLTNSPNVQGRINLPDAGKELDAIVPALFAQSTDKYGFLDERAKELMALDRQTGTGSDEMRKYALGQMDTMRSGATDASMSLMYNVSGAADQLQSALEDINAQIKDLEDKKKKSGLDAKQTEQLSDLYTSQKATQSALGYAEIAPTPEMLKDIGSSVKGNLLIDQAKGDDKIGAIQKESQLLTTLEAEYKKLGITVEDADLKQAFMMNDIMKQAPTLVPGIQGLAKEMASMTNLNLENKDSFEAQERQGYEMYTRMQSQVAAFGGGTKDALLPMQGYLRSAEEAAKRLGIPLDANTQMMIDQSKQLGIWDANAKDAESGTDKLADAIQKLVDWLNKIPANKSTTVTTKYETEGEVPGGPSRDGTGTNSARPGKYGWNDDGTPDWDNDKSNSLSAGGRVGGRLLQFREIGTDRVPAMLTEGEGIISVSGMNRIGESGLRAINDGTFFPAKASGDTFNNQIIINWNSTATNGYELLVEAQQPGGLFDQLIESIAANQNSRGTRLKRTLNATAA